MSKPIPITLALALTWLVLLPAEAAEQGVVESVRRFREDNASAILTAFFRFLSVPHVSADAHGIRENAEMIRNALQQRGARAELWEQPTPHLWFSGGLSTLGADRTVGIYLHYDGQPVDRALWRHDPWSPVLYTASMEAGGTPRDLPSPGRRWIPSGGSMPARQVTTKCPSWQCSPPWMPSGPPAAPYIQSRIPLRRRGGGGIPPPGRIPVGTWKRARRRPVAHLRRSGAPEPAATAGVRRARDHGAGDHGVRRHRYLHSGHYGNWAPNPAMRLAALLASMKDPEGDVTITGFYDSATDAS